MSEPKNARLLRAERILTWYGPVLGHDLPNLLVAILGLLQVLELEDGQRLSDDGKDYLRRIADTAHRAQDMVRLLKDIGRAGEEAGPVERVAVADLFHELATEMKVLFPARRMEYDFSVQAPEVAVPRRLLHRALAQLLRQVVLAGPPACQRLALGSRATPAGIELWVADGVAVPPGRAAAALGSPAAADGGAWETRLGFALVAELADAWGGTFRTAAEAGRGTIYTLVVPGP
jgi:K+-sensing histidine kinase KdpD